MKYILYKYNSENERVTIRADDTVIGELREIKVDSVAYAMKSLMEIYQRMYNLKNNKK